jgi:hypothetical protein
MKSLREIQEAGAHPRLGMEPRRVVDEKTDLPRGGSMSLQ